MPEESKLSMHTPGALSGVRPEFPLNSEPASGSSLSETWLILRKRRWAIISVAFAGAVIGLILAIVSPHEFVAKGRIEVRPGSANQYRVNAASAIGGDEDSGTRLESEVAILESDTLLERVARELNLQDDIVFNGYKKPMPHRDMSDERVRQEVIEGLRGRLHIRRLPKTDIIEISYEAPQPPQSAQVVNSLIKQYIENSFQAPVQSVQRVTAWLTSQLNDLKQDVEASQEKMVELQRKLGVVGLTDQSHNLVVSQLEDLTKAAGDAKVSRIVAEARYRILSSTDPDLLEGGPALLNQASGTSLLATLRSNQATLEAQYAQMNAQFGPNYPAMKQLRAQIDENKKHIADEQARVLAQAQEAYRAARTNENMASAALEGEKSDAYKLRDDMVQLTILQRQFESNRTLYDSLLERLRAAGIQAGLESSEIDVVDYASVPTRPASIRRSQRVALGLFLGLFGGVALAFLLESLDTTFRNILELETISGLPTLAVVPKARRTASSGAGAKNIPTRNLPALTQPKSQFSEALRGLRTSLMLSTVGHPPRVILFTSGTPLEGKTTTATNTAVILAQRNAKVLLIDGDLRRPTVHTRFGLSARTGLTTVLTGTTSFEEAVKQVPEAPNLWILPSGPVPPFPTEMLASDKMAELLRAAEDRFTHIVIDSPPILSITDGVVLSRYAEAVVLVVRHSKVNKQTLRRTRDLLVRSGAPLTGIVLNAIDVSSAEYYGYYGYRGYAYYGTDTTNWLGETIGSNGSGPKPAHSYREEE